jgi:hypothetical protein
MNERRKERLCLQFIDRQTSGFLFFVPTPPNAPSFIVKTLVTVGKKSERTHLRTN